MKIQSQKYPVSFLMKMVQMTVTIESWGSFL